MGICVGWVGFWLFGGLPNFWRCFGLCSCFFCLEQARRHDLFGGRCQRIRNQTVPQGFLIELVMCLIVEEMIVEIVDEFEVGEVEKETLMVIHLRGKKVLSLFL